MSFQAARDFRVRFGAVFLAVFLASLAASSAASRSASMRASSSEAGSSSGFWLTSLPEYVVTDVYTVGNGYAGSGFPVQLFFCLYDPARRDEHFVDVVAGYLFRCLVDGWHSLSTPDGLSLFCVKVIAVDGFDFIGLASADA